MSTVNYDPIGVIRSPFRDPEDTPHQPTAGRGVRGEVELLPEYQNGLRGLSGFSHVYLIYHLHLVRELSMTVLPHLSNESKGIFATRSPNRPNPLGLSLVRLGNFHNSTFEVFDLDILDGTPLLDIKPYVPSLARRSGVRIGLLEKLCGVES